MTNPNPAGTIYTVTMSVPLPQIVLDTEDNHLSAEINTGVQNYLASAIIDSLIQLRDSMRQSKTDPKITYNLPPSFHFKPTDEHIIVEFEISFNVPLHTRYVTEYIKGVLEPSQNQLQAKCAEHLSTPTDGSSIMINNGIKIIQIILGVNKEY